MQLCPPGGKLQSGSVITVKESNVNLRVNLGLEGQKVAGFFCSAPSPGRLDVARGLCYLASMTA